MTPDSRRAQLGPAVDSQVLARILFEEFFRKVLKKGPPDQPPPEGWEEVAERALDYVTAQCIRCALARQDMQTPSMNVEGQAKSIAPEVHP